MNILSLVQGSEHWHEHRATHFNASDAPAMLGHSKYTSRDELLHQYKTGERKEINAATQKIFNDGHRYEEMARPIIEKEIGAELYPVTGSIEIEGLNLSASFDGLTIDETINFEHKSLNENLREVKSIEDLDEMYKIQMDQQFLVSGAESCIFVASNGTEEGMIKVWYKPDPERLQAIIDGWKQFAKDLEDYEVKPVKPEVVANAIMGLPALDIQIQGAVTRTNMQQFQTAAMSFIESINTELVTDQHFADAEANVKFCKDAETELKNAKQSAISKTADIDELMKAADYLSEQIRQKRLTLEKLVKSEKQNRKIDIATKAKDAYEVHVTALESELEGMRLLIDAPNWNEALKNKRTIASLEDAANTRLAQAKIEADQIAKLMRRNLALVSDDHNHLFNDLQQIIGKAADDFELLVKSRISDEEKRIELARQEEKLKLEQEAEQQRIADEEKIQDKAENVEAAIAEEPSPVEKTPESNVTKIPAAIEGQPRLETKLQFWAFDNKISDQSVRSLVEILIDYGHEDLQYDDIA